MWKVLFISRQIQSIKSEFRTMDWLSFTVNVRLGGGQGQNDGKVPACRLCPLEIELSVDEPEPTDPTRHITELKRSWSELRTRTGVFCRPHDFRHTFATGLAERGVSEGTMLALMGHMS
jgi:Phage integrase family